MNPLIKILATGATLIALASASGCTGLSEADYSKAKWYKHDIENIHALKRAYKAEGGFGSGDDWILYLDRVKKHNSGKTEGNLKLPDLNGDDNVGG